MTHSIEGQFGVFLEDFRVGTLQRRGDVTQFVFEEGYWEDPRRPVLGLRFENAPMERHRSRMRLPSWFSNLLPEGHLRQWIAEARGVPVQREMELLAQVGHDLPGAVRVVAADSVVPVDFPEESEHGVPGSMSAQRLWRFSLAGVGLKFSMLARGERLTIPAAGDNGDWIVKLPDPIHPEVPRNEFAMMTLAKAAGMDVPTIRLVHRDMIDELPDQMWPGRECWAFAIKRFDRGPGRSRIHIEDMAQVRGFYPEDKYLGSFETIAALFHRGHDVESLREFTRRLAFSVLIGNGDAHLKNWSLIYRNRRIPEIAPAYDLVATFLYRPDGEGPEDMGLRLGGSRRFADVSPSTFVLLDRRLGAQAGLGDVVDELVRKVVSNRPIVDEILAEFPDFRRRIGSFIDQRVAQFGS
ncbi:type II toxin-antitoxin system HipA family toxin [Arenibaculum sp.]|jgi:serine/threonine-protein kinase HipA|uniref:type II toxin-antitoxin system HipA family toxin n=1 Tax=Arenibaculum sp. TaxID=2865862 RepID=UPI002E12D3C1|nr:type II toxin-antitoxin system HipA family toxin [Arenibaculum sp.]